MSGEGDTYPTPAHGWTCFHCGEHFEPTFAGQQAARFHFGFTIDAEPGCQLKLIRFWAKGTPRDLHQPATSAAVVEVCDDHKASAKKADFYNPQQRAQLRAGMLAVGRAEPDFDTAEIFFKAIP